MLFACHRAEVLENVPTPGGLSKYRTVGLVFARSDGLNDDTLGDVHDELKERIEGTGMFQSVVDGQTGELVIRTVLLYAGEEIALGVDLLDTKTNAVIGRFQVKAKPDREGPKTGGINLDFESKTSKAISSAAREVASYLEDHK